MSIGIIGAGNIGLAVAKTLWRAGADGITDRVFGTHTRTSGSAIGFVDERNVTFRSKKRPIVLVLACIAK
jgi:prephenate dehydrogenase